MTNLQLLLNLNNLVNELQKFYATNLNLNDQEKRLENLFNLKKEVAKISTLNPMHYPIHILILKQKLTKLLPFQSSPMHYYFERSLHRLMKNCKRLNALKTTAIL